MVLCVAKVGPPVFSRNNGVELGLRFERSYLAGTRDFHGRFMGGTDAMRLVAYNRCVPGTHPRTGAPSHWLTVAGMRRGEVRAT
jgi:hypothetical protein